MRYLVHTIYLLVRLVRFLVAQPQDSEYAGRHRINEVQPAAMTYHPEDEYWGTYQVPKVPLYRDYMIAVGTGQQTPLTMSLPRFYEYLENRWQQRLMEMMGNWQWMNYPIEQWPQAWQHDIRLGGSDLPTRGKELQWI